MWQKIHSPKYIVKQYDGLMRVLFELRQMWHVMSPCQRLIINNQNTSLGHDFRKTIQHDSFTHKNYENHAIF